MPDEKQENKSNTEKNHTGGEEHTEEEQADTNEVLEKHEQEELDELGFDQDDEAWHDKS